jgi:RNA polymerase sigma-70 factor (ECF subfamily)
MVSRDSECVRRCLDGHPEAFQELVSRYHAPLTSYIAGRLHDQDAAEEVAQEAFVRSYLALGKLRKPGSYYAWLFGIAERVMKEYLHDRERSRRAAAILTKQDQHAQSAADLELEQAIAHLPTAYRRVVLLRYYGELSCVEVAERMEIPLGTVTKRLSRAHEMLRKSLGPGRLPSEHREAGP